MLRLRQLQRIAPAANHRQQQPLAVLQKLALEAAPQVLQARRRLRQVLAARLQAQAPELQDRPGDQRLHEVAVHPRVRRAVALQRMMIAMTRSHRLRRLLQEWATRLPLLRCRWPVKKTWQQAPS